MDVRVDVKALMQEIGERRGRRRPSSPSRRRRRRTRRCARRPTRSGRTRAALLAANAADMADARAQGPVAARCSTGWSSTEARVAGMVEGLRAIAEQPDPVGQVIAEWDRPSGLHIRRVRTPLGVVGVIFESRPNVTADAGALCLKAGNAAILRGGSESLRSAQAIHAGLVAGLRGGRAAGGGDPAGADHRPGGGRRDADDDRAHRRDRAARRQGAGRPGAGRGAGAGLRASRGDRARLRRPGGRPGEGAAR